MALLARVRTVKARFPERGTFIEVHFPGQRRLLAGLTGMGGIAASHALRRGRCYAVPAPSTEAAGLPVVVPRGIEYAVLMGKDRWRVRVEVGVGVGLVDGAAGLPSFFIGRDGFF